MGRFYTLEATAYSLLALVKSMVSTAEIAIASAGIKTHMLKKGVISDKGI